jgi:hypothetical protein
MRKRTVKQMNSRFSITMLLALIVLSAACITMIPTAPGLTTSAPNSLKMWMSTAQCRASLVSVDGRDIALPPDAKDAKQYVLEAGERTVVMKDLVSGQTNRLLFNAQAKKTYMVDRYRGNYVIEENGLRVFTFNQDVGVGIYESLGWSRPLVAYPKRPNDFARVSEGGDPKTTVFHLADLALSEADSAVLHLGPYTSIYILSIMGEDLADSKIRYDYQGEYLRGDKRLPWHKNPLLGEQPLIDYAYFIHERSLRFRPGEYTVMCFYQAGNVQNGFVSSDPALLKFKATAGGRFVLKSNTESKLFSKSTWKPIIEPIQ